MGIRNVVGALVVGGAAVLMPAGVSADRYERSAEETQSILCDVATATRLELILLMDDFQIVVRKAAFDELVKRAQTEITHDFSEQAWQGYLTPTPNKYGDHEMVLRKGGGANVLSPNLDHYLRQLRNALDLDGNQIYAHGSNFEPPDEWNAHPPKLLEFLMELSRQTGNILDPAVIPADALHVRVQCPNGKQKYWDAVKNVRPVNIRQLLNTDLHCHELEKDIDVFDAVNGPIHASLYANQMFDHAELVVHFTLESKLNPDQWKFICLKATDAKGNEVKGTGKEEWCEGPFPQQLKCELFNKHPGPFTVEVECEFTVQPQKTIIATDFTQSQTIHCDGYDLQFTGAGPSEDAFGEFLIHCKILNRDSRLKDTRLEPECRAWNAKSEVFFPTEIQGPIRIPRSEIVWHADQMPAVIIVYSPRCAPVTTRKTLRFEKVTIGDITY